MLNNVRSCSTHIVKNLFCNAKLKNLKKTNMNIRQHSHIINCLIRILNPMLSFSALHLNGINVPLIHKKRVAISLISPPFIKVVQD